jgi:phosphatidylglycerophosphatase A
MQKSATLVEKNLTTGEAKNKSLSDYFALAFTTFGVGYFPIAPGTWGSAAGVLIYLAVRQIEINAIASFTTQGWQTAQISAFVLTINSILLFIFCLIGILASNRASILFNKKDPQKVVVDEVMGQLITLSFVPFNISWKIVLAGFLIFRMFDIWKPYPIDLLENLPSGLGICADDILAGVYGGICLSIIYAISLMIT